MAKLNKGTVRKPGASPLRTSGVADVKTYEGAAGFERDARTQLFLLAGTVFAGEGSFYESAEVSDGRLVALSRSIAREGGGGWEWVTGFLPWLRAEAGIRTASVICAVEAAGAVDSNVSNSGRRGVMTRRGLVNSVQQRADEPGEIVAYGLAAYGRSLPLWLKRGAGDGAVRLYDERAVLRYDKPNGAVRFADVIQLCHPKPRAPRPKDPAETAYGRRKLAEIGDDERARDDFMVDWLVKRHDDEVRQQMQNELFTHLITERKGRKEGLDGKPYQIPAALRSLRARAELNVMDPAERHALARQILKGDASDELKARVDAAMAGQWEWMRSWLGEKKGRAT